MIRYASAIAVLLGMGPAAASDRLIAEESIYASGFADRNAIIGATAFGELYKDNVRLRAIIRPASEPDVAVGIIQDENGFRILGLTSDLSLHKYGELEDLKKYQAISPSADRAATIAALTASLPANPRDAVKSCTAPITEALAMRTMTLWRVMLLEVRAGETPQLEGADGVAIHFSMRHEERNISGYDWMPWQGTNTARLTQIAANLLDHCTSKDAALLRELESNIAALENQLDEQMREGLRGLP